MANPQTTYDGLFAGQPHPQPVRVTVAALIARRQRHVVRRS